MQLASICCYSCAGRLTHMLTSEPVSNRQLHINQLLHQYEGKSTGRKGCCLTEMPAIHPQERPLSSLSV